MSDCRIPEEWKCPHTSSQKRPMLCDRCTADDVFVLYTRINNAYRDGAPVMSDQRFDMYEQYFRNRHPTDPRFWKVGKIDE